MAIKKINLSGEIGWEIMPFMVEQEFLDANGDDVEMTLATPGGSVFKGIEINNTISNYKKEFPKAQIILNIIEASSMGSHIASNPAFDMVLVNKESIAMIHNPQTGVYGDYKILAKLSDFLDRMAGMFAISYSKKMKNSIKETRSIMDEETWYIGGKAIIKAGLADGFIDGVKAENDFNISAIHANAELRYKTVMKKVKEEEMKEEDFEKISAIVKDFDKSVDKADDQNHSVNTETTAVGGENTMEDVIVNLKELKEKHPEIYAENFEAGKIQGSNEEKERVKALLEMKNKKDFEGIETIHNRIDEAIANGENINDVNVAIIAMSIKSGDVSAAIDTNEIGDLNTPENLTVSGEIEKTSMTDKEKENEVI